MPQAVEDYEPLVQLAKRPGLFSIQALMLGAVEYRADLGSRSFNRLLLGIGERQLIMQGSRGQQRLVAGNPGIADAWHRASLLPGAPCPGPSASQHAH